MTDPAAERPFVVFHVRPSPRLLAVFNPSTPDRTEAILGRAPSPVPWLLESYRLLDLLGAEAVAIACNTMHYWYDLAARTGGHPQGFGLPTVHMIEETAGALERLGIRRAGLLATTGTVNTGLYQTAAARRGVELIVPASPGEQEGLVMEAVYGARGIKAGHTAGAAERLLRQAASALVRRGAEALVLGCTEVPLVLTGTEEVVEGRSVPCLDPTRIVAERLAREAGKGRAVGIAGGLGPAATIDLLEKMGLEEEALGLLRAVYRESLRLLRERQAAVSDQDHLKHVFIRTPDPRALAEKLAALDPWAVIFTGGAGAEPPPGDTWMGIPLQRDAARVAAEGLERKARGGWV